MTISAYAVLEARSSGGLNTLVAAAISDGKQPYGQPFMRGTGDEQWFCQAVITGAQAINSIDASAQPAIEAASAPVDAVAATGTVTDGNADNYDVNQTITVGTKVYKFVVSPAAEGDIKIGSSADDSLNNFVNAINLDGLLGVPDTDFKVAAANPLVTAAPVGSNATVLTAKVKGVVGNAIALSKAGAYGSVSGAHLAGGVDGTLGDPYTIVVAAGQPYIQTSDTAATTTTTGAWKKLSIASL